MHIVPPANGSVDLPRYIPLEVKPIASALDWDLARVLWAPVNLYAEFLLAPKNLRLRINFPKVTVYRVIDDLEMLDSEYDANVGIEYRHFGYQVEGAAFWRDNINHIKRVGSPQAHYRYITGNSCVDVISVYEPHYAGLLLKDKE